MQLAWQPSILFGSVICALASILCAEIARDCYHVLSHTHPKLQRWHSLHHQLFRQDYTVTRREDYQRSQWQYDLPEAFAMLVVNFFLWVCSYLWLPEYQWGILIGVLYSLVQVFDTLALATGFVPLESDEIHSPGQFPSPPKSWLVNRAYHWRHHFDDSNAYFCGKYTLVDQIMGTSLVLKGKKIAVTGASGTLGQNLLQQLYQEGAKVLALTSQSEPVTIRVNDENVAVETITWKVGQESTLAECLEKVDILILNHGINLMTQRTHAAITETFEVNTFSTWRLL